MYLAEYDDGLGGWWTKFRDKVIRPVAHVAAAVVTGGASIPASLAIENAIAQRKAQKEAAAQAEAANKEYAAMFPPVPQVQQPAGGVSQAQLVYQPGAQFPTMQPASSQGMPMWPGLQQQQQTQGALIGTALAAGAVAYLIARTSNRRR